MKSELAFLIRSGFGVQSLDSGYNPSIYGVQSVNSGYNSGYNLSTWGTICEFGVQSVNSADRGAICGFGVQSLSRISGMG